MPHPILEAQDAIKTILAARPAFIAAGVDVRDGGPTEGEDVTAVAFWFNAVTGIVSDWTRLATPPPRQTSFEIGFSIMARQQGDDERASRATVLNLLYDLEAAMKANGRLGMTDKIQGVGAVSGTLDSAPVMPDGWAAIFTGSIECLTTDY